MCGGRLVPKQELILRSELRGLFCQYALAVTTYFSTLPSAVILKSFLTCEWCNILFVVATELCRETRDFQMLCAWLNNVPDKEEVLSSDVQVRITLRVLLLLRPVFWMFAVGAKFVGPLIPTSTIADRNPETKLIVPQIPLHTIGIRLSLYRIKQAYTRC